MPDQTLTDAAKAMTLELGADLVGVSPVARIPRVPGALSPTDHLPEARCVLVCAMRYPSESPSAPDLRAAVESRLESVVFQVARFLEDSGAAVVPLPATWPEHLLWQRNASQTGTPALGHVASAVAAGLGTAGPEGVLLTPEFGAEQALCSLLTDADLAPSPPFEGPAPAAARPVRRLTPPPDYPDRMAAEQLFRLAFDQEMDAVAILPREAPGARSLVLYGTRLPADQDPEGVLADVVGDWLDHAGLDLCRHLETLGYMAAPGSSEDQRDALRAAGLGGPGQSARLYGCLVTDALLPPEMRVHPVRPEQPSDPEQAKLDLMSVLMEEGADLVGVADPRSVDRLIEQWSRTVKGARAQPVGSHLAGARSVLVIGYHFPFASLERAGEAPADCAGVYVHATFRTARWLGHMATKALRRLEEMGYQGVVTPDLGGLGSRVAGPRGEHPGAMACRFPAAAAGLTWLGLHGAPLHPEYGVTLRFIAVITDAPLPADRPLREEAPCRDCDAPCIEACPVQALDDNDVAELECRGAVSALAAWDGGRCGWARHHALIGAEGPRWFGLSTDQPPPSGPVTAEALAAALERADPLQRRGVGILEGCLKACQMEGAWSEAE